MKIQDSSQDIGCIMKVKSKDEISKRFDKLISDTVKEKKFDVIKSDENYLEAYYKLYNELVS